MLASLAQAKRSVAHGSTLRLPVKPKAGLRSSGSKSRSLCGNSSSLSQRTYATANHATVEGTARFFSPARQAQRLEWLKEKWRRDKAIAPDANNAAAEEPDFKSPIIKPKVNKKTGWTLGPIGMGTARFTLQSSQHQEAIETALQTGATNVLDTSPNFGRDTEALVGLSLSRLLEAERIARDEIVVVGKIGPLVQGMTLDPVKQRAARGRPFKNMTMLTPDLGYCLDPEYLEFQITRSLKTMELETIDLLLIDTPELILPAETNEAILSQLYRLLNGGMAHLEEEVKRGRIQYYGLSSSKLTALQRTDNPQMALDMVLRTARAVGERNHFAAVCYPMNLLEPQQAHNDTPSNAPTPIIWSKQGRDSSLQLMAFQEGLIQLSNRPLNALVETADIYTHLPNPSASLEPHGLMYRLAQVPDHDGRQIAPLLKASFNGCVSLEKTYQLEYDKVPQAVKLGQEKKNDLGQVISAAVPLPDPRELVWAQICLANMSRLELATFKASWEGQMKPSLTKSCSQVRQAYPLMDSWASSYEKGMIQFAELFTQALELNRHQEVSELMKELGSACPALSDNRTLAVQAVRSVTSTLVTTTLVGMRSPTYVEELTYGGGTREHPQSMLPIDPSYLGNIFDVGARHYSKLRADINDQLQREDEAAVRSRREAAEEKILGDALKPRELPARSNQA